MKLVNEADEWRGRRAVRDSLPRAPTHVIAVRTRHAPRAPPAAVRLRESAAGVLLLLLHSLSPPGLMPVSPSTPARLPALGHRKRRRDADDTEFLPISKKLNNLHLEEGRAASLTPSLVTDASDCRTFPVLASPPYQPSLPLDQNPVYYEMNRILYEAHLMRRTRTVRGSQ